MKHFNGKFKSNWRHAPSYALASPTATWQVYDEPKKVRRFFSFILRAEVEMHLTYFLCSPSPSLHPRCCCLTPFKRGCQLTCCIFCKSRIAPCCRLVLLFLHCPLINFYFICFFRFKLINNLVVIICPAQLGLWHHLLSLSSDAESSVSNIT